MKTWSLLTFLIAQVLSAPQAFAEYRVYRLGVTYLPYEAQERIITTSLDNLQYVTYYKITSDQRTRLIDHWMCRGRTDNHKPYCSKPYIRPAAAKPQDQSTAKLPTPL